MSGPTFVDVTPDPGDTAPDEELPTLDAWPADAPPPRSVVVFARPCVMISCSACHQDYTGEDISLHFDSVADAIAMVLTSEWVLLEDGTVLCEDCANTERCKRFGHSTIRVVEPFTSRPGSAYRGFSHPGYSYCERCDAKVDTEGK
ncbi:hypothetical protein [Demequina sp.]|uniref:hypothetical protein n=1 Tax=Demequina sp. TaxID=2050685 RepID=UPI0025C5E2E6|nr:hypothetical protein [Demequina sp.]